VKGRSGENRRGETGWSKRKEYNARSSSLVRLLGETTTKRRRGAGPESEVEGKRERRQVDEADDIAVYHRKEV